MTTVDQITTAGELERMPDDGCRYELVRGELRKMPPAGDEHGDIAGTLSGFLLMHVRPNKLGKVYAAETGFKLATDPDTVRAPNVAFIRQERIDAMGRIRGFRSGAPDLVAEIISPNDVYAEVEEKVADWLDAGVRMVVVVNPRQRTVTVYRSRSDILVLREGDVLKGGDVVPGWALRVGELFV